MNLLAIETTTKRLCIGVYSGGKFYEYSLQAGRALSALLAPSIQRVAEALELKIAKIDYFAVGLGPGSFTGMRIGLATVKGLSVIRNKPVVGVPSLDILAKNAGISDRLIITALDARRSLIYCCAYRYEKGLLKRKSPYLLLGVDEFIKRFSGKAVILGDAVALYKDNFLAQMKDPILLDKDYWQPQAHNLMELALAKIKAGQLSSPLTVKPIYLYPKECQIKTR